MKLQQENVMQKTQMKIFIRASGHAGAEAVLTVLHVITLNKKIIKIKT
jgi:hypothetical protein